MVQVFLWRKSYCINRSTDLSFRYSCIEDDEWRITMILVEKLSESSSFDWKDNRSILSKNNKEITRSLKVKKFEFFNCSFTARLFSHFVHRIYVPSKKKIKVIDCILFFKTTMERVDNVFNVVFCNATFPSYNIQICMSTILTYKWIPKCTYILI